MPTDWISNIVVVIIVVAGIFIMYRALKEPVDLFLGLMGKGLRAAKDGIVGTADSSVNYVGEISYG